MKNISYVILLWSIVLSPWALAEKRGLEWQGPVDSSTTPYISGTYRAILVGNNAYQDKDDIWRPLNTARTGAVTLAKILENDYGFDDITLLTDASRREILIALNRLSRRVEPNDNVLIFYAGHGYLDEETERGYWIPIDARGNDYTTFLRNSTIRDEINVIASRGKHTLVIADSCFSGSLLRGNVRGPLFQNGEDSYYKKVANKRSVQVLAAGGNEFVDDNYRDSKHSPFTYFLINELKNSATSLLSFSELATTVTKAVANNVDQTPVSGVLQGAGDELGEFIFERTRVQAGESVANNILSEKSENASVAEQTITWPPVPRF